MDYHCRHCGADLDGGDIYEHFLLAEGNPIEALRIAKMYGWSETDKRHFKKSVIVQPEGKPQYVECPECKQKDPFTPGGPPAHGTP